MDFGPPKTLPADGRDTQGEDLAAGRQYRRGRLRMAVLVLVVVLALGAAGRWLHWQFTHIVLDDARVAGDMVMLASRVPGWVQTLPVSAGDRLDQGALLVQVDAREAALVVAELEARLAGIASRQAELLARLSMVDRQSESQHAAAAARLEAARATLSGAEAERAFAEAEFLRADRLVATGAGTPQRVEQLRSLRELGRQRASGAGAEIRQAEALMAAALAAREEMAVIARQIEGLTHQARELTATRDRAALDMADRTIRMPFAGVVDRIFVDPGEYVLAGQRILLVHNPDEIRIEANVKETDLRHFQIGTPVRVSVDAWPGRVFEGRVDRLVQSATSEFALLPSPNPSGNFTRITQRMPLRVRLDPPPPSGLLRPGMLVKIEAETGG